jgi:hypothetical protein
MKMRMINGIKFDMIRIMEYNNYYEKLPRNRTEVHGSLTVE